MNEIYTNRFLDELIKKYAIVNRDLLTPAKGYDNKNY
jgi:hypothetical protein